MQETQRKCTYKTSEASKPENSVDWENTNPGCLKLWKCSMVSKCLAGISSKHMLFVKCVELCKHLGAPSPMSTVDVRCCDSRLHSTSCLFLSFQKQRRVQQPHAPTADGNNQLVVLIRDKRKTQSRGFKRAHKRASRSNRRFIKFCCPALCAACLQVSLISPDVCAASVARLEIAPLVFFSAVHCWKGKRKNKTRSSHSPENYCVQIIY